MVAAWRKATGDARRTPGPDPFHRHPGNGQTPFLRQIPRGGGPGTQPHRHPSPRRRDAGHPLLSHPLRLVAGKRGPYGNDPRYNASLTFETFPFPPGFDLKAEAVPEKRDVPLERGSAVSPEFYLQTQAPPAGKAGNSELGRAVSPGFNLKAETAPDSEPFTAIAAAAADLDAWREKWLHPEGWLDWEQTPEEQKAGFPPRPVPKPEYAATWKKRTLTNLYNEMPAGLKLRQENLDRAVAAAYGWEDYTPNLSDEEILRRLLALNRERAKTAKA